MRKKKKTLKIKFPKFSISITVVSSAFYVRNSSVSQNLTLVRNKKVEPYIKIKIYELIVLRF